MRTHVSLHPFWLKSRRATHCTSCPIRIFRLNMISSPLAQPQIQVHASGKVETRAVKQLAAGSDACLPGTALHVFERRFEQLGQTQMGFLCDQLAAFRQEHAELQSEMSIVRSQLKEEFSLAQVPADAKSPDQANI